MKSSARIRATSSKVKQVSQLKMTAYFPDQINNQALDKSEDASYMNDTFEGETFDDVKL